MQSRSPRPLVVLLIACLFALGLLLLFAAQCVPSPPTTATFTVIPTLTATASPTPLPSPTPTATPIPPLQVAIVWPSDASALKPVNLEVQVVSPPGIDADVTVSAILFDPQGVAYWRSLLVPQGEGTFSADEPVQLPMLSPAGDWRLQVFLQSPLRVQGQLSRVFQPVPIEFRDLTPTLPSGVSLLAPRAFGEVQAQGDQFSGMRLWQTDGGDVGLWWAPGPSEPLLVNNALVMLEATFDPDNAPEILDVAESDWLGQRAFSFDVDWPDSAVGASETWVIQGPDYWLYVLRVRALDSPEIPYLLRRVQETFEFVE